MIHLETIQNILNELENANTQYGPFKSIHEAYAVILEELDEVWDEIKHKQADCDKIEAELLQVAAMCVKTIDYIREVKQWTK